MGTRRQWRSIVGGNDGLRRVQIGTTQIAAQRSGAWPNNCGAPELGSWRIKQPDSAIIVGYGAVKPTLARGGLGVETSPSKKQSFEVLRNRAATKLIALLPSSCGLIKDYAAAAAA
jgi:hypothetical protein